MSDREILSARNWVHRCVNIALYFPSSGFLVFSKVDTLKNFCVTFTTSSNLMNASKVSSVIFSSELMFMRLRFANNFFILFDYTGDSKKILRSYTRSIQVASLYDLASRIRLSPEQNLELDFTHFLSMSRRYGVPMMDMITIDLAEIDFEAYFRSIGIRRNFLLTQEQLYTSSVSKFQKLARIDTYEPRVIRATIMAKKRMRKTNELVKVYRILRKTTLKNQSRIKELSK